MSKGNHSKVRRIFEKSIEFWWYRFFALRFFCLSYRASPSGGAHYVAHLRVYRRKIRTRRTAITIPVHVNIYTCMRNGRTALCILLSPASCIGICLCERCCFACLRVCVQHDVRVQTRNPILSRDVISLIKKAKSKGYYMGARANYEGIIKIMQENDLAIASWARSWSLTFL